MAKKTPSANIKITSVLNTILTNPSGIVSNNSVLNTSGLSSSIKVTGGVFGAPARALSPIYRVDIQEITGTSSALAFNENPVISELVAIDISKPFSDSRPAIDFRSIQFTKGASDIAIASDSATIIAQYNPVYFDNVSEFDAISFNTIKVLTDTQSQSDNISFNTNKVLADTQDGQTDSTSLSFIKVLSDFVTTIDLAEVFDGSTYTLSKSLADIVSESDLISFDTIKVLTDSQSTDDLAALQFTKALADIQEGQIDSITLSIGFNRSFTDEAFPADAIQQFTFNKVLADTAVTEDLLGVFDGSTYTFSKSLADIQDGQADELSRTVDYNRTFTDIQGQSDSAALSTIKALSDIQDGQSDSIAFNTNKVLADTQEQSDLLSRTVDYNRTFTDTESPTDAIQQFTVGKVLADFESPTDAIQSFNFNKVLSDTATVEDLAGIFDGSLYQFIKVVNDFVDTPTDSLSRTVDYNRTLTDTETPEDRPYKTFDKAGVADRTRYWIAEGPAFHGEGEYAVDYFEITFDPVGGWPEEYALIMGPTIDFTKNVTGDSVSFTDSIAYVTQFSRTFNDTPFATEETAFNVNKILAPDFAGQNEGPAFHDEADYAPSYFADDYTELYGPIISFIKSLTDSVTTPDTFVNVIDFIRSFTETSNISDANVIDFTFAKSDSVTILDDDITTISLNKVFADSVTTIDLIDIFDGSTYTLDKSFSEIINILNLPAITFQKGTIAETMVASDDNVIDYQFVKSDSVDGNDNGLPIDEEYYSINYFPDTYIDDFKAGVIITFAKSIADFVTILDDATPSLEGFQLDPGFASPFDETVYNFIKVLTETQPAIDDSAFQFTKPLSETAPPVEGPSFSDSDGYANGWISSLYTIKRRPIFDFTKVLETISNPVADASSFVFQRGTEADSVTITDDISTFNFIKSLADTAAVLDLIGIFDGSTYTFNKTLADTEVITESKAIDFTKILPGLVTAALDASASFKVDSTSILVDADEISSFSNTDPAFTEDDISLLFTKYLEDEVTTLDLIDIFDGSLYSLNKAFNDTVEPIDDISTFDFTKVLADTAVTLDNIDIFDGSTYSISKVLETLSNVPTDDISFVNTLAKADTQSLSDDDTIQFIKALADTQDQQIGPAFYEEVDYAADYFDPTDGVMYTVLGRPIFDFIKALQDNQNQTDFTVFNLNKPLSDTQLGQTDNADINFTKSRSDSVSPTDDISTFDFIKALADTATTLDNIDIFDGSTYTIAKALQDTQNIAENKAITLIKGPSSFTDTQSLSDDDTVQFTKARSDSVDGNDNGTAIDEEYYSINYFPDTYIDDFLSGVAKSFIKALADIVTVLDEATAGLVNFPLEPQSVSLTDVNIYSFIKSLSETQPITENLSFDFTRPLSDTTTHFEGPGFGNSNDYAKNWANDLYAIKRRLIYSLLKPLSETLTAPDDSAFVFQRGTEAETLVASDENVIDYNFAKSETITVSEDIQQFTIIKPLSDSVEAVDLAGIFDGSLYSIILSKNETLVASDVYISTLFKPFTETITISDDGDLSVYTLLKPLTEILTAPIGPAYYGTEEYAASYFDGDYTELGRPIFEFTKVLDTLSEIPTDHFTHQTTKVLADIQLGQTDSVAIHPTLGKSDSVSPTDDITEYTFNKVLADTATAIDLVDIFDGSTFNINRVLATLSDPVVDSPAITIIKGPSSFTDTQSLSDDDTIQFIKHKSDTAFGSDNGIPVDEEYYAINYFPDTYIDDFLSGVQKTFTKALADSVTVLDEATAGITGFPMDPETVNISEQTVYAFIKSLSDTPNVDDNAALSVSKVLPNDITSHFEGPGYGDSNDYAKNWISSLYTIKRRPIINFAKAVADTLTAPDLYISTLTKPFTETLVATDTDTINFVFGKSDSITATDDITQYTIIKPLSDSVEAVDLAGIFDGSLYSITLSKNETLTATDVYISTLVKPLTDSVTILDDGDQAVYSLLKPLTENKRALEGPGYHTTEEYAASYFDGDYTELYNPAIDFTKVLETSSEVPTDDFTHQTTKVLADTQLGQTDSAALHSTLGKSDSVTITDDITEYTFNKVLADTATPLDLVGIFDGSTFSIHSVLTTASNPVTEDLSYSINKPLSDTQLGQTDAKAISFTKSRSDSVTITDDITQYTMNKALNDTPTPSDDIQQFTITKPLSDTATAVDLAGIFDGSQYAFNKTLVDTTGTPADSFNKAVSFVRAFTEISTVSAGTPVFNVNLAFADIVSVSDFFAYESSAPEERFPDDSSTVDDSGSLRMSDYFEDLSYFEGVYIGTERTFT